MSDISEMGTNFVADLSDAIRRNPLPAALIGMGALWLLGGRVGLSSMAAAGADRIPDAARDAFGSAASAVRSSASAVGERIGSVSETVQNTAAATMDKAARVGREQASTLSGYARAIPGSSADMIGDARSSLAELFRAQPLALGAVGLAIGAGIAAALPVTELESEYLGETSDAFKEKAQSFAAEQASRAADAAENAVNAATSEARKQGLTVDGAKNAASQVSDKVGRIFEAAGKEVSQRTGS